MTTLNQLMYHARNRGYRTSLMPVLSYTPEYMDVPGNPYGEFIALDIDDVQIVDVVWDGERWRRPQKDDTSMVLSTLRAALVLP